MGRQALDAFRGVCANERYGTEREMFPDLGVAVRALVSDPAFAQELATAMHRFGRSERVRAEYLILLLRGRMSPAVGEFWDAWLIEHPLERVPASESLAFFHHVPGADLRPCNDEVAKHVGLVKGADTGKLVQLLQCGMA